MKSFTPLRLRPVAILDIETTGLDPAIHELVEFACWSCRTRRFEHFRVMPEHLERANPKALEINGYSEKAWKQAITQEQAAYNIASILVDTVSVGHNVSFDMGFLNTLLERFLPGVKLGHHKIDTVTLAYEHLVPLGLESLSLHSVCSFLGISNDGEHSALVDVKRTKRVFELLNNPGFFRRLLWRLKKK